VGKLAKDEFDPKAFFAKVGAGKTMLKWEKNQHVFESERAIPWASTSPVSSAMRQPLRDPRRPTPVCQPPTTVIS
jgi:hypothetical protein